MTPERWIRVEELFHAALERSPEEQQAFLDDACGDDVALRRDVELLLAREHQAGSFLEVSPLEALTVHQAAAGSLVGRQLGPYRVVSQLGKGGMGEVYLAHDDALGRDVAVKTLPEEFARDPERLARFRREARTLASLNHPNIAAIYGLESSGDVDCLVLELAEGETLRGPLPIARALEYARQVAEAVEAAHEKDIIHRDLKPANVKVTPQGKVKVLDFGLAKARWELEGVPHLASSGSGGQTLPGGIAGTPGYMSPEQARGEAADKQMDVWAFGCLLYELLTGTRAFPGETLTDSVAAVLDREPDWQALPAQTPAKIRELLRQCLQKDADRRLRTIADARQTIEDVQRGRNRWRSAAVAAAVLAMLSVGAVAWFQNRPRPLDRADWVQLTRFPDSVTQPALSPNGQMVAFIRGDSTFFGPGQIYVKSLPDGEPIQLTDDSLLKMSPAFSPDGAHVAYTTVDPDFAWDTWIVPVKGGGTPQLMLKNASGLMWTDAQHVLFSEMKKGVHMGVVAADVSRRGVRDVYVPTKEPSMAHRSSLSPDGKWVLVVEMDADHLWLPCRMVPLDGSSQGRQVGPPGGGCTVAAWSNDGKWMYFTSNAVGDNHIWRQRFPDGVPEQVTSGPTSEQGITMAPDGKSFVTSMALQNVSLWVRSALGEREVSLEGNAAQPKFTPDGRTLFYRIVREPPSEFGFYRDLGEVMVVDLESGRSQPLAPGLRALDYDVSFNGKQVVLQTEDRDGKARLWLAPVDRSTPPRQIANVEGVYPRFGLNGEILFRREEGNAGFVYRVEQDGTGLRKAIAQATLLHGDVSRDGKWLIAWAPLPGDKPPAWQAFPLGGGPAVPVSASMMLRWPLDGRSVFTTPFGGETWAWILPLVNGALPQIPARGFVSEKDVASVPGARRVDGTGIIPGPSADVYAFYRGTTQRNLYRIPIP